MSVSQEIVIHDKSIAALTHSLPQYRHPTIFSNTCSHLNDPHNFTLSLNTTILYYGSKNVRCFGIMQKPTLVCSTNIVGVVYITGQCNQITFTLNSAWDSGINYRGINKEIIKKKKKRITTRKDSESLYQKEIIPGWTARTDKSNPFRTRRDWSSTTITFRITTTHWRKTWISLNFSQLMNGSHGGWTCAPCSCKCVVILHYLQ